MKKIPYFILAAAILVVAGVYFYQRKAVDPAQPPVTESPKVQESDSAAVPTATTLAQQPAQATSTPEKTAPAPAQTQGTYSYGEGDTNASDVQVIAVVFDGTKFTPSTVNIHMNDWVFFKNQSSQSLWVASGPHPVHTAYPEFDSKKAIAPGGQYKFQFAKIGTWSYHDHYNEALGGTVVVSK